MACFASHSQLHERCSILKTHITIMSEVKGNSEYGTKTLEIISDANSFNRWMYETIIPHCFGEILEIGSGIGNISHFFIEDGKNITLSDIEKRYFPQLKEKFGHHKNLGGIFQFDLANENIELSHPELINCFDTIFAINVIEHIPNHEKAIQNASKFLREGGKIVILVPAFQRLFNQFDKQLDHQRRYTAESLKSVLEKSNFKIIHSQYFNIAGMLGWIISGNILRNKIIPKEQMKVYNALVPVWKIIDFFTRKFVGISVIQVGEKKSNV